MPPSPPRFLSLRVDLQLCFLSFLGPLPHSQFLFPSESHSNTFLFVVLIKQASASPDQQMVIGWALLTENFSSLLQRQALLGEPGPRTCKPDRRYWEAKGLPPLLPPQRPPPNSPGSLALPQHGVHLEGWGGTPKTQCMDTGVTAACYLKLLQERRDQHLFRGQGYLWSLTVSWIPFLKFTLHTNHRSPPSFPTTPHTPLPQPIPLPLL